MHYYKRNLGDYAKKAGRLTMLQHGSYTLLIDACYDREQFPTRDEAIEWTWASNTAEIEAVEFVLRKFFTLEDGRYVQKRIQEELAEYQKKRTTNKRIADEREAKRDEDDTKRIRLVHEAPPNHKPITNNQEPKKEEAKASLSESSIPDCPYDALIDSYERCLPDLPRVRKSLFKTGEGAKSMRSRWHWVMTSCYETGERKGTRLAENADTGIEWFDRFFAYVNTSEFLTGRDGKWTACDLKWLLKKANFENVLSGRYHGGNVKAAS